VFGFAIDLPFKRILSIADEANPSQRRELRPSPFLRPKQKPYIKLGYKTDAVTIAEHRLRGKENAAPTLPEA